MMDHGFSDEILMSYADGVLDAETSQRLEAALARDPALADRLRLFTGTRDVLAELRDAPPAEPVSDELMARVRQTLDAAKAPGRVEAFRPRASTGFGGWRGGRDRGVLGAGGRAEDGFGVGRLGPDDAPSGVAAPELADALSQLPSGRTRSLTGAEVAEVSSFRTDGGEFCREFELAQERGSTLTSVACQADRGWDRRFAVASGGEVEGCAPASALDTLETYLSGIGAGTALSPRGGSAAAGRMTGQAARVA
ncbi:anti-sigma factor family protein [Paracoccus beibuensis]|uniref:anti-sigma factor family protein n=1 Tax=Paracoccus beibuensis TaxID=547602 RepID=UPI0022406622|nr:hypothetical protein [Paracoccus beibuensis]